MKKIICGITIFCFALISQAQDVYFVNPQAQDVYFLNPQQSLVHLNPSFAGSNDLVRLQSVRRVSNGSTASPQGQYYACADVYIKPIKSGFALSNLEDNYINGTLKTRTTALTYSRRFSVLKNQIKIIPSLQIAYLDQKLDKTRLYVGDPLLQTYGGGPTECHQNVDLRLGLLANVRHFYFGAALNHFNQPNTLFNTKLPASFVVHGSFTTRIIPLIILNVFTQYQQQDSKNFAQLKVNLVTAGIVYGLSYGSNALGSLNLGYRIRFFTVGVGFEHRFRQSDLWPKNTLEAHLSLNFRNKILRTSEITFEAW